jgi:acyl-CoA thioesterase FadM
MPAFELKGKIRWADADAAGRLFFPRIFDYYSDAEGELLRKVGVYKKTTEVFGFPRVHAECHYKKILALGTHFTLRIWVDKVGRTSIRYKFQVSIEGDSGDPAANGSVTVVLMKDGQPSAIPPDMRSKLSD